MELHLMHFLIVCPLVFLAGFVDAVAGGGGLISLPAYMIAGLPVHFAIGTNKLSSGMGTTLATARFAKNGYIAWKNALLCIVTALIGSSLGAKLALQLDDYYFKRLILVILPCTALLSHIWKTVRGRKRVFPGPQDDSFQRSDRLHHRHLRRLLRSRNRNISLCFSSLELPTWD